MNNARTRKEQTEDQGMPLEEIARRMLALPVKTRDQLTGKKKAKPRKKR